MARLKHLKASKDDFPDPKGSLSSGIPSQAIVEANWEVKQLLSHAKWRKARNLMKARTSVLVNLF